MYFKQICKSSLKIRFLKKNIILEYFIILNQLLINYQEQFACFFNQLLKCANSIHFLSTDSLEADPRAVLHSLVRLS